MREEEALKEDTTGEEAIWLTKLRTKASEVAEGSLNAVTWGPKRNRVFKWLEGIIRDINTGGQQVRHAQTRCPRFRGAPSPSPPSKI